MDTAPLFFSSKKATLRLDALETLGDSIGELAFASSSRYLSAIVAKLRLLIGRVVPRGRVGATVRLSCCHTASLTGVMSGDVHAMPLVAGLGEATFTEGCVGRGTNFRPNFSSKLASVL